MLATQRHGRCYLQPVSRVTRLGADLACGGRGGRCSLPGGGRGGSHGMVNAAVPFFLARVSGLIYAGAPATARASSAVPSVVECGSSVDMPVSLAVMG